MRATTIYLISVAFVWILSHPALTQAQTPAHAYQNFYWLSYLNDGSINPAYTGLNGRAAVNMNWQSRFQPPTQLSRALDAKIQYNHRNKSDSSLGLHGIALTYHNGYEGITSWEGAGLAYSQNRKLNHKSILSYGASITTSYHRLDFTNALFGDMIVSGRGIVNPTADLRTQNTWNTTIQAGAVYTNGNWITEAGVNNLNKSRVSFYDPPTGKSTYGMFTQAKVKRIINVSRATHTQLVPGVEIGYVTHTRQYNVAASAAIRWKKWINTIGYTNGRKFTASLGYWDGKNVRVVAGYQGWLNDASLVGLSTLYLSFNYNLGKI